MRRLYLVFGSPGAGKTFLARALEAEHRFRRVSVDDEYVEFIRTKCPILFFDAIGRYILGTDNSRDIADHLPAAQTAATTWKRRCTTSRRCSRFELKIAATTGSAAS